MNLGIIRRYYVEKWTENIKNIRNKNNKENVDFSIMDEIAKKLPMSQVDRPDWDFNKLVETGFHKIQVEISGSPLPMSFCIVAQKG